MGNGDERGRFDAREDEVARREREMLRRLEELDVLDRLATRPGEVVWPTAAPVPAPGPKGRTAVLAVAVLAGLVLLGVLLHARSGDPVAEAIAAQPPLYSGGDGRALPAVDAPVTDPTTYRFLLVHRGTTDPVTFDPCTVIHYVVRERPGTSGAGREAVRRAVARVQLATGLAFVDDGDTTESPVGNHATSRRDLYPGRRWSPLLIAWSDPTEFRQFTQGGERGIAGVGLGDAVPDDQGRSTYVTGRIVLNTTTMLENLDSDWGRRQVESVVMHELGHVLGADHVQDHDQLMWDDKDGQTDLGPGDRYGFSRLGAGQCSSGL
ncbi:hypothetical protein [Oryzobacter telluris]|uniref:hypothetical protein n=1 Tax=Oryzobacter telluris TaxID=3149179 RepID=UPI00370D63FA